jgi:hypothetical protein
MKYARVGTVLLILVGGLAAVAAQPARALSAGGVTGGGVRSLTVGGTAGVPLDALAVVLNTTVTNPTSAGFVTVFPCGAERPVASNLNYVKDQTIPNLVIAKLGAGGKVCFYSQQDVDLIVDVAGFFPAGSGYVAQASPQRAADTRGKTRVGGTTIEEVAVAGVFGVPTTAAGVALNVTITGASSDGFATVFPCGQQTPTASNVNYAKGQDIPNFVIATPGVGGKVCVFSSAPADVIVDVSGHFEAGTGFTATAAPVRFLDSRESTRIGAGTSKELTVAGDRGIPADARGVAINVTAVGAAVDGFMTVYPCGQSTPVASNLNYTRARDVANSVLAKPGTNGKVCFYSDKTVDIVVDVSGYFGPDSTFSPIPNPTRILDTRNTVSKNYDSVLIDSPAQLASYSSTSPNGRFLLYLRPTAFQQGTVSEAYVAVAGEQRMYDFDTRTSISLGTTGLDEQIGAVSLPLSVSDDGRFYVTIDIAAQSASVQYNLHDRALNATSTIPQPGLLMSLPAGASTAVFTDGVTSGLTTAKNVFVVDIRTSEVTTFAIPPRMRTAVGGTGSGILGEADPTGTRILGYDANLVNVIWNLRTGELIDLGFLGAFATDLDVHLTASFDGSSILVRRDGALTATYADAFPRDRTQVQILSSGAILETGSCGQFALITSNITKVFKDSRNRCQPGALAGRSNRYVLLSAEFDRRASTLVWVDLP